MSVLLFRSAIRTSASTLTRTGLVNSTRCTGADALIKVDPIRALSFTHQSASSSKSVGRIGTISVPIASTQQREFFSRSPTATAAVTRFIGPACPSSAQYQQRGFASRREIGAEESDSGSEEEEEFRDDNGMTMKEREKIEKWAANFTKDSIPKGLLTLNFVRSSGPGGQNVNKVNTKVDMRFVVDDAVWLPEYVRDRLKSEESNKINKNGEYVLASDRKRTQMANLEDCMEKLHEILLHMAELPKLPDAESLEKLERIKRAGDNRRKVNKQFQSKKKSNRRVGRDD
ncbi:hypothetical protein BGZ98_005858 [Dissophora globulifera]|nr:hypothetical protein BGZ98_005858 [Dissophora globulifera]